MREIEGALPAVPAVKSSSSTAPTPSKSSPTVTTPTTPILPPPPKSPSHVPSRSLTMSPEHIHSPIDAPEDTNLLADVSLQPTDASITPLVAISEPAPTAPAEESPVLVDSEDIPRSNGDESSNDGVLVSDQEADSHEDGSFGSDSDSKPQQHNERSDGEKRSSVSSVAEGL